MAGRPEPRPVQWKVNGAEFQTGKPRWGRIEYKVTILGTADDGGPRALVGWGYGRQLHSGGQWMLDRFELTSLSEESRGAYLFTDVSTSAGVMRSRAPSTASRRCLGMPMSTMPSSPHSSQAGGKT